MKKIIFSIIVGAALIFGGCEKKMVSTQYSIGCQGYQYGSAQGSEWEELLDYFSNHVEYNKLITFESASLAENDKKAKQLLNEQLAKIDTALVCSLLNSTDYFDYGIVTLTAHGEYRYIKRIF